MRKHDLQHLTKNPEVPTLPAVVQRIGELIDSPEAGLSEVGARIAEDAPLAAKVLRIVNSSWYGLPERCLSVELACAVLGAGVLRNVVVQAAVIRGYERLREKGFDVDGLWRHSALVAQVCSLLTRRSSAKGMPRADETYLSGLLHDVGQIVLLDHLGDEYVAVHERARREQLPLFLVERRDLGVAHPEIGAAVVDGWGFPNSVRLAVQLHHGRRGVDLAVPATCVVIKSNVLVERVRAGNVTGAYDAFDPHALEVLGIGPDAVREAVEHVERERNAPAADAA